jgi:hypothetical protein
VEKRAGVNNCKGEGEEGSGAGDFGGYGERYSYKSRQYGSTWYGRVRGRLIICRSYRICYLQADRLQGLDMY